MKINGITKIIKNSNKFDSLLRKSKSHLIRFETGKRFQINNRMV